MLALMFEKSAFGRRQFQYVLAAAILTAALSVIFGTIETPHRDFYDEGVYRTLVSNLMDRGFYGYAPGEQIAFRAPGYPFFNAGLRLMFDHYALVRIAQATLAGGVILLSAALGRRLFGASAGVLTALILTAVGTIAAYASVELTETLATFLLTAAVLLAVSAWQADRISHAAWSGVVLGLSILTRPQAIPITFILAVFLLKMMGRKRGLAAAGLLIATTMVTLTPWTIRNYIALGELVPVSTESGVNFWLANNSRTTGRFQEIDQVDPVAYNRISRLPEVDQDDEWIRLGLQFIRSHPFEAGKNWLRNGVVYLGSKDPWVHGGVKIRRSIRIPFPDDRLLLAPALVGVFGVWRSTRGRKRVESLMPAALVVYFIVFFMITIPHSRFRHEMIPFLSLCAANGLLLAGRAGSSWRSAGSSQT